MSTWYLGPEGDLRPLPPPDIPVRIRDVVYGGVHQALSGARTMDVTGVRAEVQMTWTYLELEDWRWLQMLYTRYIPGPLRLINPLTVNRLSHLAASADARPERFAGVTVTGGSWVRQWDWPTEAGPGAQCLHWIGRPQGQISRIDFDRGKQTPVLPGETVTCSVYLKADEPTTTFMAIDWYDRDGTMIGSSDVESADVATEWQRFSMTRTAPSDAVCGVFALGGDDGVSLYVAAPQFQSGELTNWEPGGGSLVVLMTDLESQSPRYPLMDCTATLLEA